MNIINKIKNKSIFLLIAITFILIIGSGLTYAYFDMIVLGNDNTSGLYATGITSLTLDATNLITFDNVAPGDTKTYTFTVKNTGDNDINYKLYFDNVINTFVNNSEIKYTIKCVSSSGSCISIDNETIFPSLSDLIVEQPTIGKNVTHTYTLSINFIETNENQSYNAGKKIEFKISIDKTTNLLSDKILNAAGGTNEILKKGNPDFTSIATLDEGMYATTDLDGTTYYFRGNVTNNYVKFANKTWRIVRINGDGSIRLILEDFADYYDSTSKKTYYYLSAYNSSPECDLGSVTTPQLAVECGKYGYGDYASGSMASTVNKWYYETFSLDDQMYVKQDGEFCNDTSIKTTTGSYLGAGYRLANDYGPTYKCSNYSLFTYDVTKKIISPVGILSADDVIFAGGHIFNVNNSYYLYKSAYSFTMSPYHYWLGTSNQINILSTGNTSIGQNYTSTSLRIRPVINLLKETVATGSGTQSDPYVVTSTESSLITKIIENEGGLETINSRVNNVYATAVGDEGMYRATDDDGYTYYYKGAVLDNYVSFAGFTWRIVRINGDGTVRLMLQGEANNSTYKYNSHADCASDGTSDINVAIECTKYGHGTYAQTSIANSVNNWYNNNLSKYESYIKQDGKFCNDYSYAFISSTTTNFQNGYFSGVTATGEPGFKCEKKGTNSLGEAKLLLMPVGLITKNEYMYANGDTKYSALPNNNYMVYTTRNFWMISPSSIRTLNTNYKYAAMSISARLNAVNTLYIGYPYYYYYIRPVINVFGNLKVTGSGTESDPFIILDK